MHYLTIEQRETLQAMLGARAEALRTMISGELDGTGDGTRALPDHREETDDDAVIDLESALETESLQRHTLELRAIESALLRLHTPDYGECADCGEDIPYSRLRVNPLATRCTACQTLFERTHAQAGRHTL